MHSSLIIIFVDSSVPELLKKLHCHTVGNKVLGARSAKMSMGTYIHVYLAKLHFGTSDYSIGSAAVIS